MSLLLKIRHWIIAKNALELKLLDIRHPDRGDEWHEVVDHYISRGFIPDGEIIDASLLQLTGLVPKLLMLVKVSENGGRHMVVVHLVT